jgi:hypothetical protein
MKDKYIKMKIVEFGPDTMKGILDGTIAVGEAGLHDIDEGTRIPMEAHSNRGREAAREALRRRKGKSHA